MSRGPRANGPTRAVWGITLQWNSSWKEIPTWSAMHSLESTSLRGRAHQQTSTDLDHFVRFCCRAVADEDRCSDVNKVLVSRKVCVVCSRGSENRDELAVTLNLVASGELLA